jgi:hypothetical protein
MHFINSCKEFTGIQIKKFHNKSSGANTFVNIYACDKVFPSVANIAWNRLILSNQFEKLKTIALIE